MRANPVSVNSPGKTRRLMITGGIGVSPKEGSELEDVLELEKGSGAVLRHSQCSKVAGPGQSRAGQGILADGSRGTLSPLPYNAGCSSPTTPQQEARPWLEISGVVNSCNPPLPWAWARGSA